MRGHSPERRTRVRDSVVGEPPRGVLRARILQTFSDFPGISLRLEQAARLFGLRSSTCEIVLRDLVDEGTLGRLPDGQYASRDQHEYNSYERLNGD